MQEFILDADVFIQDAKKYYSFDLCPGFWEALIVHFNKNALRSIDRVRAELLSYDGKGSKLKKWIEDVAPSSFFVSTDEDNIVEIYGKIQIWVQQNSKYLPEAKAEFARTNNADAWLIAYAKVKNGIIISEEVRDPLRRNKVPIPNVCDQFSVVCDTTFQMLRRLGVTLTLEKAP